MNDFKEDWTEHQLVAAGRGLPIPPADQIPPETLAKPLPYDLSAAVVQNSTLAISSRSLSAQSEDTSATLSPSHPAFMIDSPGVSIPFRPRTKPLASLTKSTSSTEMIPREVQLPSDPYVNGQPIETFLYKNAAECPICFLYYPPYLNKTRCCDQPICSECFVQIKRPDPHTPEHTDPTSPAPPPGNAAEAEMLVSEPAACPYCQAPEFGVTYEPPIFRRGLAYAGAGGLGTFASAMSSNSSIASNGNSSAGVPPHRRRKTSISASAASVITTDRIRPDWSTKLANARNHLARRSAAATALHTAAYLMGNTGENRGFAFGSRSRFGRNRAGEEAESDSLNPPSSTLGPDTLGQFPNEGQPSRRRSRMEDLEDMMINEAIRQSLAAEEERNRKTEKDAAKEAKKRAKEEKKQEKEREKREKRERRSVYGSASTSASGSALSLALPGIGRRRNNSGGSNLARDPTPENEAMSDIKGKGVDRGITSEPRGGSPSSQRLDTSDAFIFSEAHAEASSPTAPERPSHLRTVSNASSSDSSLVESGRDSARNAYGGHGSSSSLGTPNPTDRTGSRNSDLEPLFNYSSLAHMIGAEGDEDTERLIDYPQETDSSSHLRLSNRNAANDLERSTATLSPPSATQRMGNGHTTLQQSQVATPELMVTPGTPAAVPASTQESKQLGAGFGQEHATEVIQ